MDDLNHGIDRRTKRMWRRIALGMMICVVVACLAGCASSQGQGTSASSEQKTVAKAQPQDLQIVDSGWSADSQGYVHYGYVLKNPNEGYEASFPKVTITGKSADGTILFSEDQTMSFILVNGQASYGFQVGHGTTPATVEFSASQSKWKENDKQAFDAYTVSNTAEVPGSYGTTVYTGVVTSNEDWADVKRAAVTVILRDASGKIVYGNSTFADVPEKGDSKSFEVRAYKVPDHATFEITAQPW